MSLTKRIFALILVVITVAGVLPFASFAAEYKVGSYKVTAEPSLRIRSGPDTTYDKLGNIYYGTTVKVTEISGEWGKVSYNGISGWIYLEYTEYQGSGTTPTPTPNPTPVDPDDNGHVAAKQTTLSEVGLQMIKNFEGYRQYKYWDGGHYSIGYGSTCGANDYPDGISEAEASALLVSRMGSYEAGLDKFLYDNNIKVSQAQYDALVSFTYNFGNPWTRWDEFDLKTMLINGAYKYTPQQITDAFCQFVKSGGVVVQGLIDRRTKEAAMFNSGTAFYQYGSFKDVYTRDWYYNAVEFVNEKGIMTGVSTAKFSPSVQLTRAMMVTTLAKLGGVRIDAYKGKSSFSDVKTTDWFAPYVEWAYKNGITSGTGDGRFAPNKSITRQDLIVMLYKFVNVAGYKVDFADSGEFGGFVDSSKVSDYAVTAVKWALERNILSGNGNGLLNPVGKATRAETAQLMKNYYENGRVWK